MNNAQLKARVDAIVHGITEHNMSVTFTSSAGDMTIEFTPRHRDEVIAARKETNYPSGDQSLILLPLSTLRRDVRVLLVANQLRIK